MMTWKIDWLDFELEEYRDSLHHRVREAYAAAYKVLEEAYRNGKEKLREDFKNPSDDDERELITQLLEYEELA